MSEDKKKFPYWVEHPTKIEAKTKDGKDIPLRVLLKSEDDYNELFGSVAKKKAAAKPKSDGWD